MIKKDPKIKKKSILNPKILLICNKGSLANGVFQELKNNFEVQVLNLRIKSKINLIIEEIDHHIKYFKINLVVFISGETRNENYMIKANEKIPFKIATICSKKSIPLVYLSSLSVFGIPKKNIINNSSSRNPINLYGITKNNLDNQIKNQLPNLNYCCIAPGSIINPSSKNNNLVNMGLNYFSKSPIFLLLKFIAPAGNYSCVHIDDLIRIISIECIAILNADKSVPYRIFKNCTTKISIYELIKIANGFKPFIKLGSIPIKFVNLISIILPSNIILRIIVYFVDIEYLNEYDFLKKRPLKDYLKDNY